MAVVPQIITETKASGAQVIDGSLKFSSGSSNYLSRTPSSASNRKTWTWSGWVQKTGLGTQSFIFSCLPSGSYFQSYFSADKLYLQANTPTFYVETTQVFRDLGWYHIVIVLDTPQTDPTDRLKLYVNGEEASFSTDQRSSLTQNSDLRINDTQSHSIGSQQPLLGVYANFNLSQVYFIDGQVLDASYFGFTDPLTNTWRPKKFSGNFTVSNPSAINDGTDWNSYFTGDYDQNHSWGTLYQSSHAFDGDLNTKAIGQADGTGLTWTAPGGAIGANATTIRIYGNDDACPDDYLKINGTNYGGLITQGFTADWTVLKGSGAVGGGITQLESIYLRDNSAGNEHYRWAALEIDGVILVANQNDGFTGTNSFYLPMDGNSPIGEDKSGIVTINDGRTWSATATISSGGAASNKELSNGFDGSVATAFEGDTSGATVTVPVSATISAGGVRVYAAVTSGNPLVVLLKNGGTTVETINGANSGGQWYASSSYAGAITSLIISRTGRAPEFNGIEIGGITLIDNVVGNSWTPVNFGGSVALDNPQVSGARPILNVTQGGTQAGVGVFGSKENQIIEVTVSNASGNNRYYFDGSLTPDLAFTRGSTITFHTTNNGNVSGDSHPFKLSSTNASGSAGTEYTDGVAYYINGSVVSGSDYVSNYSGGAASGFRGIKWTVPHNQSTTYYYCTIHTGMGNNGALTSTIDETKADPYAWKNVLATPLVGSANDISNSVNSGSTTKTITVASDAASNTAQSNFYGASFYFDGTDDRLFSSTSSDYTFGTGDFTIEGWVHPVANNANKNVFSTNWGANGSILITFSHPSAGGAGKFGFFDYTSSGGSSKITTSNAYPINTWHHVAFVRNGTSHKFYINGIEDGSAIYTATDLTRDAFIFGAVYTNGTETFNGYMSDVRVYKGVAKYTSNFVVPATSPDILPDTPSGVSGGSKLTKITDGAVTGFETTSDYLSLAASSDFLFDGDHTIEFFGYFNTLSNSAVPYSTGTSGTPDQIFISDAGGMNYAYGQTGALSAPAGTIGTNKWYHIAVSKQGTNLRMFVDGKIVVSSSNHSSTIGSSSNGPRIGARRDGYHPTQGFISNLRVVKGTALYTSEFTPPTEPLTNVTNTKLLCCQSNAFAGTAAVSPNISGLNNGTQWSYYTTTTTGTGGSKDFYSTGNDANHLFDGNTSLDCYGGYGGDGTNSDIVFSPPGGVAVSSKLEVYVGYYSKIKVNGSDYNTGGESTAQDWVTVSDGSNFTGTLNTLILENTSNANVVRAAAIRINDTTVLLDPVSPEGNPAATNFNPFNTDINTVRGQETGYPTWNPLVNSTSTLSDGNLTITTAASGYILDLVNTFTPAGTGRWYWEFVTTALTGTDYTMIGMLPEDNNYPQGGGFVPKEKGGISIYIGYDGDVETASGAATLGTNTATFGVGDILGWAFDAENGTVQCYKNGVSQGTQFTSVRTDVGWAFCLTDYDHTNASTHEINFGQKPFKFPPPAGFQPLNAANTKPVKVFARPDQYVGVATYKGTGNPLIVPGLNMNPDFIWIKNTGSAQKHTLVDSVRTTATGEYIASDSDQTQGTGVHISGVEKGISIADPNSSTIWYNDSSYDYVAWAWKAGGSKNTFNVDNVGYASAAAAGITGLDGTGEMTTAKFLGCSIGTKQGFSIIKYKGLGGGDVKVPHGLSQTPDMVIVKCLGSSVDWAITHSGLPGNRSLRFTTASTSSSGFLGLNKGGLASTYFTINYSDTNIDYVNSSSKEYISYIWHNVPGLQKFGQFTGNSDADGVFVELGFKPAILLIKNDNSTGDWIIWDNERNKFNPVDRQIWPYTSSGTYGQYDQVGSSYPLDFLSNGFKMRTTDADMNDSGRTYIYAAWAAAPTFNLYGGQSNAR